MSVADIDAEQVFRCAYRLEQVAEDVRTAAARTAGAYPSDWRGEAGIAYQQRLDETAQRVRRLSVAYDAAGAALVPYARAVLEAQAMWQRSESLLAEADAAERRSAAAGVARIAGPGADEGFRVAAARLQAAAAEVEHRAAAVCAAALEDEAGRAPAPSGWQTADRFAGDLMQYGAQTVAGTFSFLGSAWSALPGVGSAHGRHEARHELAETAVAAAQIWNIPIDIRHELEDGRPGAAVAEMAGVLGPGKLGKFDRQLRRDVGLSEKEAYREADRRALLAGRQPIAQTAADFGRHGVDLANEELRGGHVLERHVAASRGFLRLRNAHGIEKAGTFRDAPTAQRLVNAVLEANAENLDLVYSLGLGETLSITSSFDVVTGRVCVRGSSKTWPARSVTVVLKLVKGAPLVYTAYPEL